MVWICASACCTPDGHKLWDCYMQAGARASTSYNSRTTIIVDTTSVCLLLQPPVLDGLGHARVHATSIALFEEERVKAQL
eukprot:5084574-Pyramimonas_sp.AAC.1